MITVFGSTNLDQIATVARLPAPGETVAGGALQLTGGGKGANQALAARRAGAAVRFVGAVGRDAFAGPALALLKADGVGLSEVRTVPAPTGIAMILVDAAGENVIVVLPGANALLTEADAETAVDSMDTGDILVLQQEIPVAALSHALDLARARGVISLLNVAPYQDAMAPLAPQAAILVANKTEFEQMTGTASTPAAIQALARVNAQTVIVTLGPAGVVAATTDAVIAVPAVAITPIDTVGAGDTFCGYLAAGLDAGLALEPALARAATAASLACLKAGAQPAIPYADELARYLGK